MNDDAIGIELVGASRDPNTGKAPYWEDDAVYDDPTAEQNDSLTWLVHQLRRAYYLKPDDVFRHPLVSAKNATEARNANWNRNRR